MKQSVGCFSANSFFIQSKSVFSPFFVNKIRGNNLFDRQIVFDGELIIALIMRRHAHDGTRAVVGVDILRLPDGNLFFRRRICDISAGKLIFLPRHNHESGPEYRIGPRGKDFYIVEFYKRAFRAANPVSLLDFD